MAQDPQNTLAEDFDPMTPDEKDARFLTVDQTAKLMHVHYQTMLRWTETGKIPASKIGGRVLVLRAELEQLIEASRRDRFVSGPIIISE